MAFDLETSAGEILQLERRLSDRDRPNAHPRVVLVGSPNAGKSRLFNALLEREQAIVSPQAGTTRDYLIAPCDFDGLVVELVDTAGIEDPLDAISGQAQSARAEQSACADLLLYCQTAYECVKSWEAVQNHSAVLPVATKGDLFPLAQLSGWFVTSAETGAGLQELRSAIASLIRGGQEEASPPLGTAARCRGSILLAEDYLRKAARAISLGYGEELVALDLHLAVEELGRVIGAVVTDDILDRIFNRFCIGK